jgi:hypothetical protein
MIFPLCIVLFSNATYRHQHTLSDGQKIEHAHPFQSCPDNTRPGPGHQHTDREIMLYTLITDSPVILMFLFLFLVVYRSREPDLGVSYARTAFSSDPVLQNLLRAPPIMS